MKLLLLFLLSWNLVAAEAASKPALKSLGATQSTSKPAGRLPRSVQASPTKVVVYGSRDVASVLTSVRFSTLIVLPKEEQIIDFICGDKDMWVVDGAQNFASIKPAKVGSQTNLHLITASGNFYSFLLSEVSQESQSAPDVKVFVEPREDSMIAAAKETKFVLVKDLDDVKQKLAAAQDEVKKAKETTQAAIDSGISAFVRNVRFPYRFEAGKKPFFVRAMYTNDRFTYIQARPEETPTLYEVKDGKPNLVNFEYQNGLYTVGKVLGDGYLTIGKQKLAFSKQD